MWKQKALTLSLALCVTLTFGNLAHATILDLNVGTNYGMATGPGGGRAIGFLANQGFTLNSFGIYGNLVSTSYDVVVYSSLDGHSSTGTLATYTSMITNSGTTWYDINTNIDFAGGSYYIINWRPSDSNLYNAWVNTPGLDYYYEDALPADVGVITLIDGIEGYNAENSYNYVYARSRLDYQGGSSAVPEPASLSLLGLGLLGLLRRRRAS